jgi:hypothetical protein
MPIMPIPVGRTALQNWRAIMIEYMGWMEGYGGVSEVWQVS